MSRLDWTEEILVFVSPSDKVTSSTYFHTEDSGVEILKLLTIIKTIWDRALFPGGNQQLLGASQRMSFLVSLIRKSMICGIKHLRTPNSSSLSINILYPMRSRAFEKSKNRSEDGG